MIRQLHETSTLHLWSFSNTMEKNAKNNHTKNDSLILPVSSHPLSKPALFSNAERPN